MLCILMSYAKHFFFWGYIYIYIYALFVCYRAINLNSGIRDFIEFHDTLNGLIHP